MSKPVSSSDSILAIPKTSKRVVDAGPNPTTEHGSELTGLRFTSLEEPRSGDVAPIDHEQINRHPVAVIGLGAVGSHLAEMLAKLGVMNVTLIDFDKVDATHLNTQGYSEEDLGLPKVRSVERRLKAINKRMIVEARCLAYEKGLVPSRGAAFCCVDSIHTRRKIFRHFQDGDWTALFDGKMTEEAFQVYCLDRTPEAIKVYRSSLFPPHGTLPEGCKPPVAVYVANIAAAILCAQFKRWAMNQDPELLIQFDLFGMDCFR